MDKELVSIIVPVYNASEYLENCIKSLVSQTYEEIEIVLIDDGSKDESPKICDKLANIYDRIIVSHTENKGAAAARNAGVRLSNGAYITFVDSDDTVTEDFIEVLYNYLKNENSDIAVCGYYKVFSENRKESNTDLQSCFTVSGKEAMEKLLYQQTFISAPWGSLSKRKIWEKVSFPEGEKVEDVATVYRQFEAAEKLTYINRPLYNYYQRSTSTVYSTFSEKNRFYYQHTKEIIEYIEQFYPDIIGAAYNRHFSACFQILSETKKNSENKQLVSMIYEDIKKIRKNIISDKKSRKINRCAAVLSYFGVGLLHGIVRIYYKKTLKNII